MNVEIGKERIEGLKQDLIHVRGWVEYTSTYREEILSRIEARLDLIDAELIRYWETLVRISGGDENLSDQI